MLKHLLIICCFLFGLASPAWAQTTFLTGDANTAVTITGGGLTLTSTQSGNFVGARASQAKQSGSSYFEFTLNHTPIATDFGVASGGVGNLQPAANNWSTAAGYTSGNNTQSAIIRQDGAQEWNNIAVTGGAALASGKTGAIDVNLDVDPGQMWVTSDVTNLVCNGSGSSGSTAPKWNGSCANDPTLIGTGNPTNVFPASHSPGTGAQFLLIGFAAWPIWQGELGDSATFNFGTYVNPTSCTGLVGTVPTGSHCWNDPRGNTAYPGPLNPLKIVASNAPGFLISHAYVSGDRVDAGAGWSGSAYTSGLPVCVFGLVTLGTSGTDPTVFNTACASGTPSNTGGIPGGSWPGATTVTSGGATFALLSRIDYATATNAFNDSATTWATNTAYPGNIRVRGTAGNIYFNNNFSGTCVSASSGAGPTGTSPATDNTCSWVYASPLVYSSNANIWPTQLYFGDQEMQYNFQVVVTFFYGGPDQQVYGPQQSGEGLPLFLAQHQDFTSDQNVDCFHGYGLGLSFTGGACGNWYWKVTAAPGDSFQDNFTPSTPLNVDPTKGVTFTNTAAISWPTGSNGYFTTAGEPIALSDSEGIFDRIQLSSTNGIVIAAHGFSGPAGQHTNNVQISNSILMSFGTAAPGALFLDGGWVLVNDVVACGSTATGAQCADFNYENAIVANTTFVGTGATNSTCITSDNYFGFGDPPGNFYNILCSGFSFPLAQINPGDWPSIPAANNATTSPAGGYGGSFTPARGGTLISVQLPGVNTSSGCGVGQASPCSGLTAANELVNPTIGGSFDARLKSGSDVIGAGASYSVADILIDGSTSANITDIIGQMWTASPSRYDIGPEKFQGGLTATMLRLHMGLGHTW